jgi:hypothetical protein
MTRIHIWRGHIRVPHLDLILVRPQDEPLSRTLERLSQLGFDTRPTEIELHGFAGADDRGPRGA